MNVVRNQHSLMPEHELLEDAVGLLQGLHGRQQDGPEVALSELLAES